MKSLVLTGITSLFQEKHSRQIEKALWSQSIKLSINTINSLEIEINSKWHIVMYPVMSMVVFIFLEWQAAHSCAETVDPVRVVNRCSESPNVGPSTREPASPHQAESGRAGSRRLSGLLKPPDGVPTLKETVTWCEEIPSVNSTPPPEAQKCGLAEWRSRRLPQDAESTGILVNVPLPDEFAWNPEKFVSNGSTDITLYDMSLAGQWN